MHKRFFKLHNLLTIILLVLMSSQAISQVVEPDKSVCTTSTIISAVTPGGVWSTLGTASIVAPSSLSTTVNNLVLGINTFTYTIAGTGSKDLIITNNQIIVSTSTTRPDNCLTTATLTGSAIPSGGTGVWSLQYPTPGVIIANTSLNVTTASSIPFGNTIFLWTVSANGCAGSAELSIVNNLPSNNLGTDQSGCTSTFYIGAATPPVGGNGKWTQISGPTVIFDNTAIPGVEITSPIGTSVVRWNVNYSVCSSSKDFNISNHLPAPNAGVDQSVCKDTVLLSAVAPLGGEQGNWSVIDPQGEVFTNQSIENPMVTKLKQGTTSFQWTLSNAFCSASDFVQVVNNRPSINAGPDNTICANTYMLSADNPTPLIGTWTCANASVIFNNSHSNQAQISNLLNNTYTLTWTVTNGTCTARDNVILHTDFVTISAGINKSDCSDTLILSATAGTGYWTITYGDGSIDNSLSNNTIARNISYISHFKWTILSGACTFSNEIEYVNQLPSHALAQLDKTVCSNQAFITADAPKVNESGIWTKVDPLNTSSIENPSLFQTLITNLKQGINTFKWTIYNQFCSTNDIVNVTNNSITTNAGSDQIICGSSTALNATNAGGIGYWTSSTAGVIFSNSTSPTSSISNLPFGANSFQWTRLDLGCTANDEVIITNQLSPTIFAGIDQVVCADVAYLSADNPTHGAGVWSRISGAGSIANVNLYQSDVTGLALGPNIFRWTVTYNSCSGYDDVMISNNRVVVSAGVDQITCNQPIVHLAGTAPSGSQTGLWTVVGGNGSFSNASLSNSDVSSTIKGTNTYKWTLKDAYCSNFAQVIITNNTPDSAKVGANQIICTDNTPISAVAVTNGVGSWSVPVGGGNIQNQNLNNTFANAIPRGLNTYRWTVNKNGCILSADLNVTNNSVDAIITADQFNICSPLHSTTLTAIEPNDPGALGLWTKISAGSGIIESPSNFSTAISNLANGEIRFKWTVSNAFCSSFDVISVINDYYTANAVPVGSANLCVNHVAAIGTTPPVSGSGRWTANNGAITFSNASTSTTTAQSIPLGTSTIYWTITNNSCAAQTSFNLYNYSITTNAGIDAAGCLSTANLNAQALQAGQSGYWTANYAIIIFSNSLDPNSSASNLPAGTNLFTWTLTSNGCTASDDLIVNNYSFSVSAGNDKTICGTNYSLAGSDPLATGVGNWSVISGTGLIANLSNFNTNATNLSNGDNVFRWTVQRNGCSAFDEVNIINDFYLAQASAPASICINDVLLTATALPVGSGTSVKWTTLLGGGVFDDASTNITTARGLSQGLNRFRWTVSKGSCISTMNIDVQNNRLDISAGTDQVICVNNTSLFAAPLSVTGTGQWTCNIPGVLISSSVSAFTNVSNLSRGANIFAWTVSDKGCTGNATVIITNSDFDAFAGNDQTVIVPTANMDAQYPGLGADGQWTILNGNGIFSDYTNPTVTLSNLGYGINTYRWTVNWNGCYAFDDVAITYNVAEAHAGTDQVICNNYASLAADPPMMGFGNWSLVIGTGQFQSPASNLTLVNNVSPGINTYRWTVNAFGVFASDDVSVTNNSFTTNAGIDQATCDNEVFMGALDAGPGGTGSWYITQGSGVFENYNSNNTRVSNLQVGVNHYVWEVQRNGCSHSDTVYITHYQPTTVADAGADVTICDKNSYILTANFPAFGTGIWSTLDAGISFSNPSMFNTIASNLQNGSNMLWWTITNTRCQSADEVTVFARKTVSIINLPVSRELNEGQNSVITVETSGDVEFFQWQKDGVDMINNSRITGVNQASLNIANLKMSDEGFYNCIVKGYCNTLNTGTVQLSVISGFEELSNNGIKIYPNPSKGIVYFEFENTQEMKNLNISSINGEKIFFKQDLNATEIIDMTNYADGVYFISIQKGNEWIRSKLIIQK